MYMHISINQTTQGTEQIQVNENYASEPGRKLICLMLDDGRQSLAEICFYNQTDSVTA